MLEPVHRVEREFVLAWRLAAVVGFVLCVCAFWQLAEQYELFLLPQQGVTFVPERELAFYAYYAVFGSLAFACALRAFAGLAVWPRVAASCAELALRPRPLVWVISLLMFGASLAFRRLVLEGQPIADDEATYLFIARTLLSGRLVNPLPPEAEFFHNQFLVFSQHGWYGKYPIGHPLWLALGELLHVTDLMMPLSAALCVPLCYGIGRRLFAADGALFGCALLLLSPHFVWTAGTLLSQPTCCLLLLLGVWCALRAEESGRASWAWFAGAAFCFGTVVRPLPGGLFAAVALIWAVAEVWRLRASLRARSQLRAGCVRALAMAVPIVAGGVVILLVNYVQTGDPLSSGYHEATVQHHVVLFANGHADIAHSVFGALVRENVWLFGVPGGLLLCLFARPQRHVGLLWGLCAAELAYRLISPKTVVATTGPIYLTEIVPLLVLLAADGLLRLCAVVSERWRTWLQPLPLVAAAILVASCLFVPVQWRTVRRAVAVRALVFRALDQAQATRALVFSDALVNPTSGYSWAYFPDNPTPDLSDRVLFVRVPRSDTLRSATAFWQRHFADRRAFFYLWDAHGEPSFQELSAGP